MQPRLFYFCHDVEKPTGGARQIYRHVDILNRHGHEAYVLHGRPGFRHTWFANTTRVIDQGAWHRLHQPGRDVVVLPEDLGVRMAEFHGPKVIFNQNVFYGFAAHGSKLPQQYPYQQPDVLAVLTGSEHNAAWLRFAFPSVRVVTLANGVDAARYPYRPLADKRKQIACVLKNPGDLYTLYHLLQSRACQGLNRLGEFRWVFLDRLHEYQFAAVLSDALLLVFLSTAEGFGLTAVEGLLAGCVIVAYRTGPPADFLPAEFLFEPHDLLAVARRIEEVAAAFPQDIGPWQAACDRGREQAIQFSLDREERDLVAAWQSILNRRDVIP